MKWIIEKIVLFLANRAEKKGNMFVITGGDSGDTPYLVRYIVYKGKLGCIFIHRFMRSDTDDPHDHPWNFWTYIVSGKYIEIKYDRSKPINKKHLNQFEYFWTPKVTTRYPGSLVHRKAEDIHRVLVRGIYSLDEIEKAPLTVCITGPRKREWGFWLKEMKGSGYMDWRAYLDIKPQDDRTEGSE